MAAARLEMLATYIPTPALPSCPRSSRNPYFVCGLGRGSAGFPAVPTSSFSSASSGHDSSQLREAAPSLSKGRLSALLESEIWSNHSTISSCHGGVLETIEKDIDKLELVLTQNEEEIYGSDFSFNAEWEAKGKFNTVKAELCHLQTLLKSKEDSLNISLAEATKLKTLLQDTQIQVGSLNLYKEANQGRQAEELSRLEKSSGVSVDIIDKHVVVIEAMKNMQENVQNVWESIVNSHCSLVSLKVIEVLQFEASISFEALLIATKELEQEKSVSSNLLSKLQKAVEDLKERGLHISRLQHELANANHKIDVVSKEVLRSDGEVSSLREKVTSIEGLLEKERRALRAARDGLDKLDQALGNEESKVDDLFKEVSSLKAKLEQKERTVSRLTVEAERNKGLAETARKHLNAFHQSEKKVQQLVMNCSTLQNEIRSKDMLLDEIKKEAFKSTEALKLAAQIKQDLNLSKQREVELTQDLERARLYTKDLSQELMENSRAVKAEMALRQAEKDIMDLTRELTLLKTGIQSRDEVIQLMEEKIEGNIHILRRAADDREDMRKMQNHIQNLESKLKEFISTP